MKQDSHSGMSRSIMVVGLVSALVIALTGCPGEKPISDPPRDLAAGAGLAGYPGQNTDSTRTYLSSLNLATTDSAFEGYITCDEPAKCDGADSVRVSIVAESRAHKVPVRSALDSAAGYIVARIRNLDRRR
nr:hypothetical protein [Gemmatimonadota bacterium]